MVLCQVERLDDPSLMGKPLAVQQFNAGGFVAVSYEVRPSASNVLKPADACLDAEANPLHGFTALYQLAKPARQSLMCAARLLCH